MTTATIIQNIVKKSNNTSSVYIPTNQFIPFVCVFIIAKTPTFLLAGFVLGYIMILQPKSKKSITESSSTIRMVEAPPPSTPSTQPLVIEEVANDNIYIDTISDEEAESFIIRSSIPSAAMIEDNNSSIDFENLMKFPSCPTTLPRLDTHFNFVIDHDIQSPDPSKIDWSAIHQEIEYDQQREQKEVVEIEEHCDDYNVKTPTALQQQSQHPLLLLHQLQQDNLSMMMFIEDELSSVVCTSNNKKLPSAAMCLDDAAILYVDNHHQEDNHYYNHFDSIPIEDLLLLPQPKSSISSPGQLIKSKFQKAVKKIKRTSNLVGLKQQDNASKRSSILSNCSSSRRVESLNSAYYQQQDPLFSAAASLSPRPSASARAHDHFKGRLNKLFKK